MSVLQAQLQGQVPSSVATEGASLTEPRSIVQSLISKFQAAADITVIQEIDAAYERLQRGRVQKLAASRDALHRTRVFNSLGSHLPCLCRVDEEGRGSQVGGTEACRQE